MITLLSANNEKPPVKLMRERILDYICEFAEKKKSTPNQNQIAKEFKRNWRTIDHHLTLLQDEMKISIDEETRIIIVDGSVWQRRKKK